MFSSCSLLLACKVSSVDLYVGVTDDANDVRDDGLTSVDIPVGETAYFYAKCTVTENPDSNDIIWDFDLNGDGDYIDSVDYSTRSDYDELYATASKTYNDPNLYDGITVRAHIDNDYDSPGLVSESCEVTAVGVLRVVKDDPGDPNNSGPLYACVGSTVDLEAIPDPNTASFPSGEPTWEITSQPSGSDPNLSPSTGSHTTVIDLDVPGDYVVEATCGTDSNSITITVLEIVDVLPDDGYEYDDGDDNPDTRVFMVDKASSGDVTVYVLIDPVVPEAKLPVCWSLTGGSGSSKLFRTISKTATGEYVIQATCGGVEKTATIYVVECEFWARADCSGLVGHAWWKLSVSIGGSDPFPSGLRRLYPPLARGWACQEAGYRSSTGSPIAPGLVSSDSGHAYTASHTWQIQANYHWQATEYVGNLSDSPGTYNLLTNNCVHKVVAVGSLADIEISPFDAEPCSLGAWLDDQ